MAWVKQSEDMCMPEWLKEHISAKCSYCGCEKENFYNERGECTSRRCSNPECPATLASRIADMCKILGIPGIKEGRGLELVRVNNLKSHYDALPLIIKDTLEMPFSTFMRISFIPGIDSQWSGLCGKAQTLEELYERSDWKVRNLLNEYNDRLRHGLSFVKIKKPVEQEYEPVVVGNVMISGNLRGWNVRENFIASINQLMKGLVRINVCGKRKTGVMCLIQEKDEPNRGKAECAIENRIPILTPEEFVDMLLSRVAEKVGGDVLKEVIA